MYQTIDYTFGLLALFIFFYRIIFIMLPLIKKGIQNKEISEIFKSFTLLV